MTETRKTKKLNGRKSKAPLDKPIERYKHRLKQWLNNPMAAIEAFLDWMNRIERHEIAVRGFLVTLFGTALSPIIIWNITITILKLSEGVAKALLYILLVLYFIIFTFFGKAIVNFIFSTFYNEE